MTNDELNECCALTVGDMRRAMDRRKKESGEFVRLLVAHWKRRLLSNIERKGLNCAFLCDVQNECGTTFAPVVVDTAVAELRQESFEVRTVKTGPKDSDWALSVSGLEVSHRG